MRDFYAAKDELSRRARRRLCVRKGHVPKDSRVADYDLTVCARCGVVLGGPWGPHAM